MRSLGTPERVVAVGAGLLLAGSIVGSFRYLGTDGGPAAGSARGTSVLIQDFQFGPTALTVPVGAVVTWQNEDEFEHTVAGAGDVMPDRSPDLGRGDTYEFTFAEAGTYEYRCTIHPNMLGIITVEGA